MYMKLIKLIEIEENDFTNTTAVILRALGNKELLSLLPNSKPSQKLAVDFTFPR